ncbi:hypothetical protein BZG02_07290 [Labilibaculum filiforme]|uniref:SH3b domain-containing protein n=1 Tax=Labilibaculum filiforme TaxID=1940526 RepID=A0A2N3I0J4_9BACT|nr:SH3 domain-containing protein [Labilibaculum filiforme]PKQ63821.1 hypothetical protein BZG02_07290 [Labilibaculum filiforme]
MKKIAIVIFGLCICFMANAQVLGSGAYANELDSLLRENKRQVDEIDSMTLYKAINGDDYGYKAQSSQGASVENEYIFYFDESGNLRKYHLWSSDTDAVNTSYFNTEGGAIRCSFFTSSYDEGYSIYHLFDKEGATILFDFKQKMYTPDEYLLKHIFLSEIFGQSSIIKKDSDVYYYTSIQSTNKLEDFLLKWNRVDSLYKPQCSILVKFIPAKVGDFTFINCNSVPVYAKLSEFSEPIALFDYGNIVTLICKEEEWCKVQYNNNYGKVVVGYVKKEFLAPIELTLD